MGKNCPHSVRGTQHEMVLNTSGHVCVLLMCESCSCLCHAHVCVLLMNKVTLSRMTAHTEQQRLVYCSLSKNFILKCNLHQIFYFYINFHADISFWFHIYTRNTILISNLNRKSHFDVSFNNKWCLSSYYIFVNLLELTIIGFFIFTLFYFCFQVSGPNESERNGDGNYPAR